MATRAPSTAGQQETILAGGSIRASQVVVGVVATQLAARTPGRLSIGIKNLGATAIFVGPSTVTLATGMQLLQNESLSMDTIAAVFAISAAGGLTASVIEVLQ